MSLPTEIWLSCLESLDLHSLLRCRPVCRQFLNLIDNSSALQYKIELAAAGLAQVVPATDSASALSDLEAHQRAWSSIEWNSSFKLSFDGIKAWEIAGEFLACQKDDNTFTLIQPSALRRGRLDERQWSFHPDFCIDDFTMDPAQDLILGLRCKSMDKTISVHAMTLSGNTHPRAAAAQSTFQWPDAFEASLGIRVFGRHVGLMTYNGTNRGLHVFDWTTGQIKFQRPSMMHLESFAFLTENILLTAVTTTQLVPYEELPDDLDDDDDYLLEQTVPSLWVFDLFATDNEEPLHSFELPLPEPDTQVSLEIYHQTAPTSPYPAPFVTNNEDALFAFGYGVLTFDDRWLTLFVPRSTLLRHISSASSTVWSDWGPSTRVIETKLDDIWVCVIHGMKAMINAGRQVKLYDFNQLAIRRGNKQSDHIVTQETELSDDWEHLLSHPLGPTSLPFSVSTKMLPCSTVEAVMLFEDAILAVTDQEAAEIFTF